MSTTDDRIVSMQFDNADFERRLSETLQSLDKLNRSIQETGTKNGLEQVQQAVSGFNTGHMASALDAINGKLSALGVVGASVIQKLTQGFMGFAGNMLNVAKQDVLSPIITGGKQRALDLQQAKFQFQGLGIDVNQGMKSALDAVKGTAYGLNEAAMVAAQFGASGIKAGDQMTRALTGISGIAAMTGRSYGEIGQIFTSMAGQGKVSSMDLMEFGIRGVNAAAAYGQQIGKTEAQVRQMVASGKVDFASFADAMDKAFGKHAKDANQTYAGALDNLHAALSRMGASFFSDRLVQERDLFNALTPVVDNLTAALQPLTTEILKVAGAGTSHLIGFLNKLDFSKYTPAISEFVKVIGDGANLISTWMGIIKTAFRDMFPPELTKELRDFGGNLDLVIKALTPTGSGVAKVTTIFKGLFAVFSIVGGVLKGVVQVFEAFFASFGAPAGGAVNVLVSLANALIRLQNYLVVGGKLHDFFQQVAVDARLPVAFIEKLVEDIRNLFTTSENSSKAVSSFGHITDAFNGMSSAVSKVGSVLSTVETYLSNAWSHISTWFSQLGTVIAQSIKPNAFQGALSAINAGLIGGLLLAIKKLFDTGFKFDIGGGAFGQIQSTLKTVNTSLLTMQSELKAKALMDIAIAIGVLAASLVVLSLIKPDRLEQAMGAMAAGFAQLVLVMKLLDQIGSSAKIALLSAAMIGMAGATLVLAGSVAILSHIDGGALAKGLTAVGVALALLIGSAKVMADGGPGMIAAGVAMNAMATGLVVMAGAVRLFSLMSWGDIAKGLVAIAGSLVIIALTMRLMPVASTIAAGLAMIPLATGITILAGAVRIFATMSWAEIGKGLVGLAGSLVIIAVAMNLMPLTLPLTAAGLVLLAVALGLMVPSIKILGDMDISAIGKALLALAGILLILVVATNAMTGAIVGAAALLIVANAMLVLSGVMKIMGSMSWGEILKGLGALAAVLAVLGLAAFLMTPVIPSLLALGVALTLVGAGFALFGAGAFLVASAFSIMAVAGSAGAAAIIAALTMLIKALPGFVSNLLLSVEQAATVMLAGAGPLLKAIGQILDQVLKLVIKEVPVIAKAIAVIITSALVLIRQKFPDIIQTAFDLLVTFLKALDKNLPKVLDEAVKVIVTFVNGLVKNIDKLVDAGINLITSFLAAIGKRAGDLSAGGLGILIALLGGIANNIVKVLDAGTKIITNLITGIGNDAGKIASSAADAITKFIGGIGSNVGKVIGSGVKIAVKLMDDLVNGSLTLVNGAATALEVFLYGLDQSIKKNEPIIIGQALQIGKDIITGIVKGISDNSGGLVNSILGAVVPGYNAAKNFLNSHSPSRLFAALGASIPAGITQGIESDTSPKDSIVAHAEEIVKAFSDSLSHIPDSLEGINLSPRITPVLDLTKVKAAAAGLGDLLATKPIAPAVSFAQASTIATTAEIAKKDQPTPPPPPPSTLRFEQTINSPTPLSAKDIYRNTNSQIARAKEELNI